MNNNMNDILEYLIMETTYLQNNEEFLLSDLFKGYEWKRLSCSDRVLAGRIFRDYVNKTDGIIKVTGKTQRGHQKYTVISIGP